MRRVWSETLPHEALVRREVLALLGRYDLSPVIAVRPWDLAQLGATTQALADAGLDVALWPMTADADGRWASTPAAGAFVDHARRAMDRARGVAELAVDLEPPFAHARALAAAARSVGAGARHAAALARAGRATFGPGRRALVDLYGEARARGARLLFAVSPHALLEPPGATCVQRAFGLPLPPRDDAAHVTVMAYTSMLEGLSRGLVGRRGARAALRAVCHLARARFGQAAGVSVGVVGTGAFGDEPVLRAPRELAEDAADARARGCPPALFDLGGVLARPPAERWLEAFVEASP